MLGFESATYRLDIFHEGAVTDVIRTEGAIFSRSRILMYKMWPLPLKLANHT